MNTKAFMEKDNEISSKYLEQAEKNAINKEGMATFKSEVQHLLNFVETPQVA